MLSSFLRLTSDGATPFGNLRLNAIVIRATAAGDTVAVYDGADSGAGRLICTIDCAVARTNYFAFDPPIYCEAGAFFDLSAGIVECSVLYTPDDPPRRYGMDNNNY